MSTNEFASDSGAALTDEPGTDSQFAMLDLALITPSPTNPRKSFDEAKMLDLVESIVASGVHQAILVRPLPAHRLEDTFRNRGDGMPLPTHEIVSGERRFRASQQAGLKTIPAMIRQLSDQAVLEIQIVENLQRDDLTELEEAEGYQRLCDETGIAKELVGERIGKSRSYVYGRMKLLDLSSAPREALRSGEIDASKALLIARIPDEKLQIKALTAAMEKDYQGSPVRSYRALQSWVQQNVMLKLSGAKFSIKDASLVPAAGDCTSCSKRTGANPDLFTDVDGPDVCTDPPCFHAKAAAHSEQMIAQARAKGMEVIEGKEALELRPHHWQSSIEGYAALDEDIRGALSERELKGKVKLFVDPHNNEISEVIPEDLAEKAYAKASKSETNEKFNKQMQKDRARQAEHEEKRKRAAMAEDYQRRWRKAAVDAIAPRIRAGEIQTLSANLLRRVLLEISLVDNRCDEGTLFDVLELQGNRYDEELTASSVRSLDDNEVGFTLLLLLLQGDLSPEWDYVDSECVYSDSAPAIEELAGLLSIDIDSIKGEIRAQIRAEQTPQSPSREDLAAQPEGSAKGEKLKSKPAAPAKKGRTSKEEASAKIAEALQELEEREQGEIQAPTGAGLDEGAAPAAPGDAPAAPQVGDRVAVDQLGDMDHEREGNVLHVLASGKARVLFDGDEEGRLIPIGWLRVTATGLWPFPLTARQADKAQTPALKAGDRVKVKGSMAAGFLSEYIGKEGIVKAAVDGTSKWVVNLAKPKKAAKLVELDAGVLEVLA
ncbi:ParB/RepB/Spo0J family partition protein [Variovorax sp. V15]|uniref:ParB/RepB/Spo0J family partition protein n=1 Tax=Variovorax sp. V15 TaxID=3065952 RepID=UPI0034E8A777